MTTDLRRPVLVNSLEHHAYSGLWEAVVVYLVTQLGGMIGEPVNQWLQQRMVSQMTGTIQLNLIESTGHFFGIRHLDEPDRLNQLQLLRDQSPWMPMNIVMFTVQTCRGALSAVGVIGVIAGWSPLIALLSLVSMIPYVWAQSQGMANAWQGIIGQAPESRKMHYVFQLALDRSTAQEIRVFGLTPFLRQKYAGYYDNLWKVLQRSRTRQTQWILFASGIASAGVGSAFVWTVVDGWNHVITVGQVAQLGVAIFQALAALQMTIPGLVTLWGQCAPYTELLLNWIRESAGTAHQARSVLPIPADLARSGSSVEFRDVSFTYPNGRDVLHHVSFILPPGQHVALVGANGSGKTTLIKLLLRMYDPTQGSIFWQGNPLPSMEPSEFRRHVSVCLQEYGRYHFTVAENITWTQALENSTALDRALSLAHADFVYTFPDRVQQELGNLGAASFDLSGGQWQRIAIARAAYRDDAKLIVLDEPTAAIDPETESDLLNSLLAVCERKTALIVTHRLSLARRVDRILVMVEGAIYEDGTHEELMARNGVYANMFRAQASFYHSGEADKQETRE